jgi:hypothetical protein
LHAIAMLEVPECPESLEYLKRWLYALHGRSGEGMNGAVRLTYTTIVDWARLMDVWPTSAEVDALMMLDALLSNPGDDQ